MQMVGFILLSIGFMVSLFAKRIVMGKIKLDSKEELQVLLLAAVIAVRITGCIVMGIGFVFMLMGA